MKARATSVVSTTVFGEISEADLLAYVRQAVNIPADATVFFYVDSVDGARSLDEHEPLKFTISFKGQPVTTPPASADVAPPT